MERDIIAVVDAFMKNYLGRSFACMDFMTENVRGIWTGKTEVFENKEQLRLLLQDDFAQIQKPFSYKMRQPKVHFYGKKIAHFTFNMDCPNIELNNGTVFSIEHIRVDSWLVLRRGTWLIDFQHLSLPAANQEEGESYPLQDLERRNVELEALIQEKTAEISQQSEQIQEAYQNIQELSQIGRQITAELNFNSILEISYQQIRRFVDAPIFALGIYDPKKEALKMYAFEQEQLVPNFFYYLNEQERPAVWCFQNKQSLFMDDCQKQWQEFFGLPRPVPKYGQAVASLVYIPLWQKQKVSGVLSVQSFHAHAYSKKDIHFLQNIALYVAIALENARLLENLNLNNIDLDKKRQVLFKELEKSEKQKRALEETNQKLNLAYQEIAKINQDTKDSIKVAQRIQNALMPDASKIGKAFSEAFVLFMPRDVVSGDFYWFFEQDQNKLLAVADCTGHGVPGALISMMGMQILNKIVTEKHIFAPHQILDALHQELSQMLQQKDSSIREGMDIALINIQNKKLYYSGAMNSLHYVQNQILYSLKADKKAICGQNENPFSQQELILDQKTEIYLFSDGYQDQFGGEKNKKFMVGNFKKLLVQISEKPMTQQGEILEKTIRDWISTANEKQTDDITVLGFRV